MAKWETTIYILFCLILANVCWYAAYANQEADYAVTLVMAASFLPMLLALVITKMTKEGWDNLGVAFHFRDTWSVYLLSVLSTLMMVYLADPLMLLCFPKQVSTTFSLESIPQIGIMTLIGTASLIECLGEELGWIGYLFPRLERTMGTMVACIVLGLIRGGYHVGIVILMDYPIQMFIEITISNILLSFWMVYMYKKSNSIFPCSIQHGISNLLPIFLVYESKWYYTSGMPIIICMIPAMILGGLGLWRMSKEKLKLEQHL